EVGIKAAGDQGEDQEAGKAPEREGHRIWPFSSLTLLTSSRRPLIALRTLKIIITIKTPAPNVGSPLFGPSVMTQPNQPNAIDVSTITAKKTGTSRKKKRLLRDFPVRKRCIPQVPQR
ncbi:MAG: hypothetical protein AB3N24_09890, partial [Leisingera sp.]